MLVRNGRDVGVSTVRRIINGVWWPVRSAPTVPVGRVVLQRAVARGRVNPKRPPSFAEAPLSRRWRRGGSTAPRPAGPGNSRPSSRVHGPRVRGWLDEQSAWRAGRLARSARARMAWTAVRFRPAPPSTVRACADGFAVGYRVRAEVLLRPRERGGPMTHQVADRCHLRASLGERFRAGSGSSRQVCVAFRVNDEIAQH